MKKFFCTTVLTLLIASAAIAGRQDYPEEYLGLPGDNLNLYAVMNLFQESETLEAFERSLNEENTRINNLDLNNDGYVDYLTVSDYVNGNVHTIVIRSVLDRNEFQDVAVFTVEQLRNGEVQIQLIGDEALYGRNYIVEPNYAETPNPGYKGRTVQRKNVTVVTTTYYEVAAWPVIRFIYSPRYVVWRSSWYWGYYPVYWRPWKPFFWHYYYGYHYHWYPHYYAHYRVYHTPRWSGWNDYYYRDKRIYSKNVTININNNIYKTTYSRPESRRDGEALYAKVHPERASSMSQTANTLSRRSASGATRPDRNAGAASSVSRRGESTAAGTGRSSTQSGQASGNARRSSTETRPAAGTTQRSRTDTGSGSATSSERRPATTVNQRSNSGSSEAQTSSRRSGGTSVTKPAASSQAGTKAEPARTSRPETSAPAARSRRSSESSSSKEPVVRQRSGSTSKASNDNKTESTSSRRK